MVTKRSLARIFERRMLTQLCTGFSSGLPLALTGSTLQMWFHDYGVELQKIGLFTLLGLPYILKFLWAPFFDRYYLPILGRRRSMMLIVQLVLTLAIGALGFLTPQPGDLLPVTLVLLFVTFLSASQDIVLDAYRRENFTDQELALGSAWFVNGYRLGMIISGAFALYLAGKLNSWPLVYWCMAGFSSLGILTTLFLCQEEPLTSELAKTLVPVNLKEALTGAFEDFLHRHGWSTTLLILLFVLFYKVGEQLASSMWVLFLTHAGYLKTEISTISKIFGMAATIIGGIVGALGTVKFGLFWALMLFGFLQGFSLLSYAGLAWLVPHLPLSSLFLGDKLVWLALVVFLENFTSGMATSAYVSYTGNLTNKKFTATQYAFFMSLMGIPRVVLASPAGYLVKALGWSNYFMVCMLLTLPGLGLLYLLRSRQALFHELAPEA